MKRVKHLIFWLVVIGIILLLFSTHVIAEDDFHRQRYALVNIIKAEVMETRDFLNQESLDEQVFDALLKVPRHEFVRDAERPYAYDKQAAVYRLRTDHFPALYRRGHDRSA